MNEYKDMKTELDKLVNDFYTKVQRELETDSVKQLKALKDLFDWLCNEIDANLEHAQELYKSVQDDGLTMNIIETEGYLRCALELSRIKDDIVKSVEEK
jgi:hypothetical protein